MSISRRKLQPSRITFFSACREPTGRSMCDSGGESGRGWQQPELKPGNTPEVHWEKGCSATISTPHYLSAGWTIDRDLQRLFAKRIRGHAYADLDWWACGKKFCTEELRYELSTRGNVYNGENDFSQIFVYEVWNEDANTGDHGIYARKETVTVFYMHTGADARGGYGRPLFCRTKGDGSYAYPIDCCAEYVIAGQRMIIDGKFVENPDWGGLQTLSERWQNGYSSWPYGRLEEDVAEWHEETRTIDTVEVTLKTGHRVVVEARMPYLGS